MNRYPGLFKQLTPGEVNAYRAWADVHFDEADDELQVKAVQHPAVRRRFGELLIERADAELGHLVPDRKEDADAAG